MHVLENCQLPRAALPGIDHVTLAGSDNGLKHLSIWRQSVAPGGATPSHRHACEEVVLVQRGQGELHLAGEVHRFGPDSTLIVPPDTPHQIINTGNGALELIGVFSATPVAVFFPDGRPIELPWAS